MDGAVTAELDRGVRLGYRPELDGLRAIAVVIVIAFHFLQQRFVPGGFLGVDLFFVLSGFLITRLLLEETARHGRVDLGAFYVRRAARLLPAVVLLLAVCTVDAFTTRLLGGTTKTLLGVVGTLAYVNNWVRTFGFDSALGHTWSLSIEEQFYILWPVVLLIAYRRAGIRGIKNAALVVVVIAAAETAIRSFIGTSPVVLYNSTDTHGGVMLMAGCLLATVLPVGGAGSFDARAIDVRRLAPFLVTTIVAMVTFVDLGDSWYWDGAFLLVPVCFALLVVAALRPGVVQAGLRHPALVWVGGISYGLYLWHYPVWFAVQSEVPGSDATVIAIAIALTVGIATLSFYYFERPIRRAAVRYYGGRRPATVAVATTVA
jgi:peptidoglycan/LPS O-acetylase OafA/YrhL